MIRTYITYDLGVGWPHAHAFVLHDASQNTCVEIDDTYIRITVGQRVRFWLLRGHLLAGCERITCLKEG